MPETVRAGAIYCLFPLLPAAIVQIPSTSTAINRAVGYILNCAGIY